MARPRKRGADYFPFDVGFFSDIKIRIIMANYGADGVLLYIYLLTLIYEKGYYIKYDDELAYIISADLKLNTEKTEQMISFFCKRSLFDDKLFTMDRVLTSSAIQRRYQEIIKSRAVKNKVTVDKRFWVLDDSETQGFILVRPDENYSENNQCCSRNNTHNSKNNPTNKSKVNKSKVVSESPLAVPLSDGTSYIITNDMLNNFNNVYCNINVLSSIHKLIDYLGNNPDKQRNSRSVENYIRMWLEQDNSKAVARSKANSPPDCRKNLKNTSYDISLFSKYDIFE